jgi:hypothetical protein
VTGSGHNGYRLYGEEVPIKMQQEIWQLYDLKNAAENGGFKEFF